MMVYDTQDHCFLFWFRSSSGVLKNIKERDVSETGSVSVLRWGWETLSWFR
jgi:hypothetical protein